MSLMERFNVICWGNDFLLGLCVRKTECPEGSTEKYNILASFSINFMALSFIFTAPPKEDGENVEGHSNNTSSCDWNVTDHITAQNAYRSTSIALIPRSLTPPLSTRTSILPSVSFTFLRPLLHPFTSPSLSPSIFVHTPSLSLGSRSCFSLPSSVSLHPFLSLSLSSSVSVLDHKELSAGRINKPSVAYWEPVIAALHRRLIPPILAPSSFYSFLLFVLSLTSFVLSWHEVWLSAGLLHVQPE